MGDVKNKMKGAKRTFRRLDPGRPARKAAREQADFYEQQEEEMNRQEMLEDARVEEEEDRIRRKRSRMLTGGRSLLIGTSQMGTTSELGGGGMYG